MMELQAGPIGTAKQFYQRHKAAVVWAVLSVTGLATGATAALALMQAFLFSNAVVIGASTILALLAAYALLRHRGFAALIAIAPLPGLIWAAPIASGSDFGAVPFLAYGLGVAAAMLYGDHKLKHLLQPDGAQSDPDVSRWGAGPFAPALATGGLITMVAPLWFCGGPSSDAALQAVADSCLALLSVALLQPLGLSLLHFDEAFVVRANRAREQRGRWLDGLTFAAVPRWGLSLTGISAVFLVLGWYGVHDPLPNALLLCGASFFLAAGLGGLIAAGWREGFAVAATIAVAGLLTFGAKESATALPYGSVIVLQCSGLAALLSLYGAWQARQYRRRENARAARGRVLADCGGSLIAVLASAGSLLPLIVLQPGALVALAGVGLAGLAGVLLSPAVATGLEAFFPRRATVEDLYGRRSRKR